MKLRGLLLSLTLVLSLSGLACKEEFGGLGIEVDTGEGKVTKDRLYVIRDVFKGGTGELAGLLAGDKIISVDGQELVGLQHEYIVMNLLRGKPGTMVTLQIDRNGQIMVIRALRGRVLLQ
jgi:carboxyl-terminal processing protease